jgi:hypothetical protein
MKRIGLCIAAAVIGLVLVPTVASAKGPKPAAPAASIDVVQAAPYYLGETISFAPSYPVGTKNVSVALTCSQNNAVVYVEVGWPYDTYSLGGSASQWRTNGGGASCTAVLQTSDHNGVETALASKQFDVSGSA